MNLNNITTLEIIKAGTPKKFSIPTHILSEKYMEFIRNKEAMAQLENEKE